jgi:hypothetical protein
LQALIDNEIPNTSFIWNPDGNYVKIIDDIFRKSKRIRKLDPKDIIGKDRINIRFQIDDSESSKISLPHKTVILELEGTGRPPAFVPENSLHHLHQIHILDIGGGIHNTLEVEDIPRIQNTPETKIVESTSDVQGSQTPEHVTWGCESPKTPWLQQREQRVIVPLNLDPVELAGGYYPSGKGLFLLIIIHYVFVYSYLYY